ncbi:hypothetical protein MVEN_02589000 [Mycena venus]|uniref:Uncharacterized protein n=1 Tax=Mycena venus TaxID=2733690 RepID=A0A8H6WU46_9AGAR|nr:hypothetical protein MVEN_02589000 [Mycena venus]
MVNPIVSQIQASLYVVAGELFLYGAYFIMFGFYLYTLRTRGAAKNRFLTHNIRQPGARGGSRLGPMGATLSGQSFALNRAANSVYVTSNVIADSIFLFRCYAIWNFRLKVIIFPGILILGVAGLGYTNVFLSVKKGASSSSSDIIFESFEFNQSITISIAAAVVLMALSGGRIWWLSRVARSLVGKHLINKYHTALAMILESGALYCAGAISSVVVSQATGTPFTSTGAILGQLVGIAPTVIAVRVGLGKSVENVDSFVAAQVRTWSQIEGHSDFV